MNHAEPSLYPIWLRHAMQSQDPVQVTFPGGTSIQIDRVAGKWQSDTAFDSLPLQASEAVVHTLPAASVMGPAAEPLSTFLWAVQLRGLQDRLAKEEYDYRANLLKLVSWPNLTELPAEVTTLTARICALLAYRHSTSALLMPALLDAPQNLVYAIIELLHVGGHLQVIGERTVHAADTVVPEFDSAPLRTDSLISKIWHRLQAGPAVSKRPLPDKPQPAALD